MKKLITICAVVGLILAVSTPVLATLSLGDYYMTDYAMSTYIRTWADAGNDSSIALTPLGRTTIFNPTDSIISWDELDDAGAGTNYGGGSSGWGVVYDSEYPIFEKWEWYYGATLIETDYLTKHDFDLTYVYGPNDPRVGNNSDGPFDDRSTSGVYENKADNDSGYYWWREWANLNSTHTPGSWTVKTYLSDYMSSDASNSSYDDSVRNWQHVLTTDFSITPEPATIGLLGFGALSLLRRKK